MWGCKEDSGSSGALLGLILASVGTAAFTLLALLGGYLIALGAVALIILTPLVLAELELYEWAVRPAAEPPQAPEAPSHKPITVAEVPARLPRPAGESEIRQVA